MAKQRILLQLDGDDHASVFDAVVAVDAGTEHLLQYHSVRPEEVRDLIHGAMFTRGPQDLQATAIFIGGANVEHGEALLKATVKCFFGPMRVSVMFDANGANTTSSAAVLAAARHLNLAGSTALVLAGTGPVGQRAARLLAQEGCHVKVGSRSLERAAAVCDQLRERIPTARLVPTATSTEEETVAALQNVNLLIAAGAAGVELLSADKRRGCPSLRVAVDLNAVPPLGLGGVEVMDKGVERDGATCYGAIGVGGTKMKIHKAAIQKLFERNDQVLDAEEIFALGRELDRG